MTYERLLRAVAVILTDKAENDDLLLKVSMLIRSTEVSW